MPAFILGGLLTLWGVVGLVAAPARGVWSRARGRRMRPRLVITATPGWTLVVLGNPGPPPQGGTHPADAFGPPVGGRMADFAWVSVRNDQVRPQGDATGVSGDLTFYEDGRELFSFPARWRDSLQVWQTGRDTSPIPDRLDIRATRTREMDCALIYDGEGTAHGFNAEGTVWPWSQKPEWALTAAGLLPDPAADRRRRRGPDGGLVRPQRRADPRDAVHHPSVRLRKRALASGIRPAVTSRVAEITRGGVGARFIRQVAEEPGSLCGIARRRDLMMGLVSYRALVFRVAVVLVGCGSTMTDGIDYFWSVSSEGSNVGARPA